LITLSFFFFKEIILLLNRKSYSQEFVWDKTGIGFIQNCHVWIAVLETKSLNKIRKTELKQLSHLKSFSLELDIKNCSVRVFLYAKSNEKLREVIKKSKPILDVVLPDLKILPGVDSSKLFNKRIFEKIGNINFLKNKNQHFMLNFDRVNTKISPFTEKIAFSFFSTPKNKKEKNNLQSQWYSFNTLDQNSFFNSLISILINHQETNFQSLRRKKNLERIQIRYQIEEQEKHSFQEGIVQFEKELSILLSQIKPESNLKEEGKQNSMENDNLIGVLGKNNPVNEKILNITPSSVTKYNYEDINHLNEEIPFEPIKMNQICYELCNIQENRAFSKGEKANKCARRANFCQKLLKNENFLSIIENILKQNHEEEVIHLTTELRHHLSYQQLICIFAHLTQTEQFETVSQEIIGLIHVLFKLNFETQENSIHNNDSFFSLVSKEKNGEKIFLSLTSN
jgi:hypothetical protein